MGQVILKSGREKSIIRHHPWIFSGAIERVENGINLGETVDILSANGDWLARGAYSPHSQIRVRIWSWDINEQINSEFFFNRLQRAIRMRANLIDENRITAYRLANSESDGLPGLIVDRYGDFLVCQFLSAGAEYWKNEIVGALHQLFPYANIYNRSDVEVRQKEGLSPNRGVLWGDAPPELIEIQEADVRMQVDILNGHKTGAYLDQRENRMSIAPFCQGKHVLNCFAYTGGFGLWAMRGGARHVINIESSPYFIQLAERNIVANGFNPSQFEQIPKDVFQVLRQFRELNRKFDIIVLDPPKFAESANQLSKASRGYKDINWLAFQLLDPGGLLFTFSCSGHVSLDLFQKIVADAALDAGREVQIIRYLNQSADHPISLNFPEGRYLKGIVCRVI
ncbi:MAG: class I SAM-dependent methyltransferase [candidate division KSB1 bacterium]|nr:class I SAM-dependent methyltransferase [candidate division KSB1 bacterium]MDZ7335207.1 class I SAM-dependent methyltransferase [candidate division KSB1 bacterium]MDZ7400749.1 class I SAM-dependent methyltransferase [candidate division KSB1 bacterium]